MYERVSGPPKQALEIREKLLKKYAGKNLEGLNIDRVNAYFASENLVTKPYIVVRPKDLKRIARIDKLNSLGGRKAVYSNWLGMSIIIRDPVLEAKNSAAYTEGLIVHEGAHSTASLTHFLHNKATNHYRSRRLGMALIDSTRGSGYFLEEGWADYHRGKYLGQNYQDGALDGIAKALNWNDAPDHLTFIGINGRESPLPLKYLHVAEDNRPTALTSSLAGFAVELLIQTDPEIRTAMLTGRSDITGLREVARRVDSLSPALYPTLRQFDYSQNDFSEGLHTTIDALGSDPLARSRY